MLSALLVLHLLLSGLMAEDIVTIGFRPIFVIDVLFIRRDVVLLLVLILSTMLHLS